MRGICLDSRAIKEGLFQQVIQYKIDENGEVIITLPMTGYRPEIKRIRNLSAPPKHIYGKQVSPRNHPNTIGVICSIRWHFKRNRYFYLIRVNGKVVSKRYFDDDLKEYLEKR